MKPLTTAFFCLALPSLCVSAPKVEYHALDAPKGTSRAVAVSDAALVHTGQLLPLDASGKVVAEGRFDEQLDALFGRLDALLAASGAKQSDLVKLNFYTAADGRVPELMAYLEKHAGRTPGRKNPAITVVVGHLPNTEALVALDAIAVAPSAERVKGIRDANLPAFGGAAAAVLPAGPSVYVAGQAEKGASPAEATRKTLESLRATLKFLGLTDADVVQAKAFLVEPHKNADGVVKEFEAFFGAGKVPPLVFVDWKSSLPIEIELVAAARPPKRPQPDVIEFLTPPGMTTPTVYSRVARISSPTTIYVGGLTSRKDGDGAVQVADVFTQLGKALDATGSDFRHLAKATYYVSDNDCSAKLNELRPRYYDPRRPPAASKAMVPGVGAKGRGIVIDMIAVPSLLKTEGPPERGHGLSDKDAAAGWLALFDGKTDFGWHKSRIDEDRGLLTGGTTTVTFPPCEIRGEAATGGSVLVGDREFLVAPGPFHVPATHSRAAVVLGDGFAVKSIAARPLGLKDITPGPGLAGWKRIDRDRLPPERRPTWKVTNGVVECVGGPGALEYPALFGDVLIQVTARSRNRHANGGLFFRSVPGDFMNGYEVQIYSACEGGDPAKPWSYATGGLDDRQNARRLVSRDYGPFVMTVIADGTRISTWVNGHQTVEWNDTRPRDDNPRKGRRVEPGTIQLQAHDPATDLEWRRIAVAELK